MQYPLNLSFKVISWGPQIFVTDATGKTVLFVHMKALKLKEDIIVYRDDSRNEELFRMKADRVIDFSARYNFTHAQNGADIGSIKREGIRSIFKATYNIMAPGGEQITHTITEDNPMIRLGDMIFESIPVLNFVAGYVFHPSYTIHAVGSEQGILQIEKQPAFFEGKFELRKLSEPASQQDEVRMILAMLMMILLERMRG